MCNMHYMRVWSNGSLKTLVASPGEPLAHLNDVVLLHKDKKQCLVWPYSCNNYGYAVMRYNKRTQLVSRIVCRKVNGRPPVEKRHAAHSCGKGHEGCINPHHLNWATVEQNQADRIKHGTSNAGTQNGQSKLTDEKVRKILRLMDKGYTNAYLAARFGVTKGTINPIRHNKTWKHIDRSRV